MTAFKECKDYFGIFNSDRLDMFFYMWFDIQTTIARAQKYVEDRILDVEDSYVLTICAYALELAESSLLPQVRQKVKDAAVNESTFREFFEPSHMWLSCSSYCDWCNLWGPRNTDA